jgi:tRNA(adenine34) deaminase
MEDNIFMQVALDEAKKAFDLNEVPVGAVIVVNQQIISRAHNQTEGDDDATSHAELLCIRRATKYFNDWRLSGATLYTTLEPCLMCAGAIINARVARVVWGAPDLRQGACGSLINVFTGIHPIHNPVLSGGCLQEEAAHLMRTFFQGVRCKKCSTK